ncbi:SAF domain-containing protein [Desulfofalx alkaliphila]|uniref:SAF domain-containing protein n=1 Tax=Desulfofalx alkaliphila TaxID=105483 RepID=UPI001EE4BB0C|nr:SAF domain-containing protein [Desulfofalx alkaliphila]
MLKKYLHIILAIALAVGGATAAWYFIQSQTPTERVVVTKGKYQAGTVLTQHHIGTKLVGKAMLPDGAITSPEDVIGRTLTMSVLDDEVVRADHLIAGQGNLSARLVTVAPGRVAVDLPQDAAAGLRGIEVGDRVNIYGEIGIVTGDGQDATIVDKVAENAIILYAPNPNDMASGVAAIIIACEPEEEKIIADVLTRGKRVTLFLQQEGVQ